MRAGAPVTGVVLLHGLTGTPSIFAELAAALAGVGAATEAPLLPGHGTSPADLATKRWADWEEAATAALARVREAAGAAPVVVVGHSMGGSLACRLASRHAVDGVVAINPFVDPPATSFREMLQLVLDQGHRSVPAIAGDAADPAAREDAYGELPVRPLLSLCEELVVVAAELGRITCPVLVITSRVDNVVPPVSSDVLAKGVSGPVTRLWLERSHHLAPVDHDRDLVTGAVVEFVTASRTASFGTRNAP